MSTNEPMFYSAEIMRKGYDDFGFQCEFHPPPFHQKHTELSIPHTEVMVPGALSLRNIMVGLIERKLLKCLLKILSVCVKVMKCWIFFFVYCVMANAANTVILDQHNYQSWTHFIKCILQTEGYTCGEIKRTGQR